jgi:excisionase family DNA binding protein
MSAPEAISQRDAATRLGISRATVERWVNQGRLNTVRTGERGGARRVLIDDTFHAAKNASRKIPHKTGGSTRESLTSQNASPGSADEIPHARPELQTSTKTESLSDQPDETGLRATTTRTLPESLAPDSTKSLTPDIEESLTGVGAPDEPDVPSTSASSERQRHPLDAELVPLSTNPQHARPRSEHRREPQSRRTPVRAAFAILLLGLAVVVAFAIYTTSHHPRSETAPPSRPAGARGAQAQATASKPARSPGSSQRHPRGGHARSSAQPTPTTPPKSPTPAAPARSTAAPHTSTPSKPASQPHRQHPITPCQSSGICVPH